MGRNASRTKGDGPICEWDEETTDEMGGPNRNGRSGVVRIGTDELGWSESNVGPKREWDETEWSELRLDEETTDELGGPNRNGRSEVVRIDCKPSKEPLQ